MSQAHSLILHSNLIPLADPALLSSKPKDNTRRCHHHKYCGVLLLLCVCYTYLAPLSLIVLLPFSLPLPSLSLSHARTLSLTSCPLSLHCLIDRDLSSPMYALSFTPWPQLCIVLNQACTYILLCVDFVPLQSFPPSSSLLRSGCLCRILGL